MALEELQDLKGVWSELSKVWEQIDQMKEQPWVSVQPRKVRYLLKWTSAILCVSSHRELGKFPSCHLYLLWCVCGSYKLKGCFRATQKVVAQ